MAKSCFLSHVTPCQGGMSREHYISRSVLELLGEGSVQIGGLDWQAKGQLQSIGIGALTAKILCEKHNSSLSHLDAEAGRLFQTIHLIDKQPDAVSDHSGFDGRTIERWLLKLAAGLALGPKQKDHSISHQKVEILVTSEWPNGWGLYVQMPKTPTIHAKGLEVELRRHPETGEVLAIRVYIAGVSAYLLLGVPDVPSSFGMHRPRGLIFRNLPG